MATNNNSDIFMVPYEDLPDEDKDIISKAIEETSVYCPTPRHMTTRSSRNIHCQEF